MSVRRALAPRAVHLRIIPQPTNLSESREIFRVLQRFGEISAFKYLRYEYHSPADNVALAIYRDPHSAQQALDASPIRFALEKVVSNADADANTPPNTDNDDDDPPTFTPKPANTGIDEMLRPSTLINRTFPPTASTPTPSHPPMPFDPRAPPPAPNTRNWTKWFQVTVDRSRAIHQDFVERQPYWKQFSPTKSMAQEDLAKVVPHIGLSDVSKRPPNAHRTPNKVLKTMSRYVEREMPTLRGMAENNEAEIAFKQRRGL